MGGGVVIRGDLLLLQSCLADIGLRLGMLISPERRLFVEMNYICSQYSKLDQVK